MIDAQTTPRLLRRLEMARVSAAFSSDISTGNDGGGLQLERHVGMVVDCKSETSLDYTII